MATTNHQLIFILSIISAALLQACGNDDSDSPKACTTSYNAGLVIDIKNKDGSTMNSCGATVLIEGETYSELLSHDALDDKYCKDGEYFAGAYERLGKHTISIKKEGYYDWVKSDINLIGDGCHVLTQQVTAYIEQLVENDSNPSACHDNFKPAIELQVADKSTGSFIGCDLEVELQDGDYHIGTNSHGEVNRQGECIENGTFKLGYETAGNFNLSINKLGYQPFKQNNIVVTQSICGINTVSIQAQLIPY